ncbi:putative phosphoesterase [Methanocella paludicola SANAE]|uniref:Phosphoesterase n=1 Tax=Methanocella paludicola (strain DSM 17711 / JCM 13418 / NBRC 101707 / SANAE) TaxID=304371 RepID=D1YZU9_METPS|nr:metallophosphoesterase [Methanocella paludicola]BAI61971.1 putative phosphoesterase [Methanocella paludicola SANAE]
MILIKIGAMADLHFGPDSLKTYSSLFKSAGAEADIIILCGDLTMRGLVEEARGLVEAMGIADVPIVSVLGNHDHEANNQEEIMDVLEDAGVKVLERGSFIMPDRSVGVCGTKGFCGGFAPARIAPFGERILKMFINETYKEANKVNRSLKSMKAGFKVVAYHYAPVRDTCIGERCEIIPFLGSSILSDPVDTFRADLVLHGHSHNGSEKGSTLKGVPVRNVALHIHDRHYCIYDTGSFSPSASEASK